MQVKFNCIRPIYEGDLDNLRKWKNDNREAFFFQKAISPKQQLEWFHEYQKRPDDFMFVVLADDLEVGCMGIRVIDKKWDVYNVILCRKYGVRGLMSKAIKEMINAALLHEEIPVTVKVLKGNSAVDWYKKNSFVIVSEHEDHYFMSYQGDDL